MGPAAGGCVAGVGRAWWTLPRLPPSGRTSVRLAFPGAKEVDAADLPWYVAGIDEGHLLGAEPLPGDWDVRLPRAVIEAAQAGLEPIGPVGEEAEVDYDAAEGSEKLEDDE